MALLGGKRASDELRRGRLVAWALAGSWRATPAAPDLSPEEWTEIAPHLLQGGCGGLGWRQYTLAGLPPSRTSFELQIGFNQHERWCRDLEKQIEGVFELLRGAGVEPLLSKGWAVARLYPERGLRPYGDIDLCVHPEDLEKAEEALRNSDVSLAVDLHSGFVELPDRSHEELLERSRLVRLGHTEVRILGAEDQLRHQCLHLLKHGAYRPLWLCDLGAMLEPLPVTFDWDYCLGGDTGRSAWAACALGLADQLLGAGEGSLPESVRAQPRPAWVDPTVLRQWGCVHERPQVPSLASALRRPVRAGKDLGALWPNPVEARVRLGMDLFARTPGAAAQLSWFLRKAIDRIRR